MRVAIYLDLRDVLFMNHKLHHAALRDKPLRRAIHINAVQSTTDAKSKMHFEWLVEFLAGETQRWGHSYSDRWIATAGASRKKMLARAIDLGFWKGGCVTRLQDLA